MEHTTHTLRVAATWTPPGGPATTMHLEHHVPVVDAAETRIAFSVPTPDGHEHLRIHQGRLYRLVFLPERIESAAPTIAAVHQHAFRGLEEAIAIDGLLWATCSEPGYVVTDTANGTALHGVIPDTGSTLAMFNALEHAAAVEEALNRALDAGHLQSAPAILASEPIIVTNPKLVMLPNEEERRASAAVLRQHTVNQIQDLLGSGPVDEEMIEQLKYIVR